MKSRPGWDEYFAGIARLVGTRSTCLRRRVGAVIVLDRRVLATGYNGAPAGLPHCEEVGCLRETLGVPSGQRHEMCRGVHAEQNAIVQAARHGVSIRGATVYTTAFPCSLCAKMLINAGVVRVVYCDGYPDGMAAELLEQAGVETVRLEAPSRPDGEEGSGSPGGCPPEAVTGRGGS